jgi:hypothetical protein
MSEHTQAREIVDMPWGGVAMQGQYILFDLRFSDGGAQRYACQISTVPLLLGNLSQYANMAENVRMQAPDRAIMEASPYKVTEVIRSGYSLDGKIVSVEYNTTHGFPVSIALTPDQARRTIEFLQREILLAENPRNNRH